MLIYPVTHDVFLPCLYFHPLLFSRTLRSFGAKIIKALNKKNVNSFLYFFFKKNLELKEREQRKQDGNMAGTRGLLVPLGCARHRACTCGLSTGWSIRALRGA